MLSAKHLLHVTDKKTDKSKTDEKKKAVTTDCKPEEKKEVTPVSSFFGKYSIVCDE